MENKKLTIEISTKSIFKFFTILIFFLILYVIRDVLAVLLISLIIVTAFSPMVQKLHKFKIPKSLSVISFYLLFFGFIGLLVYSIVPQLIAQVKEMASDIPKFIDQLNQSFGQMPQHDQIASSLQSSLKSIESTLADSATNVFSPLIKIFGGIVTFFVILVLTLYMSVAEDDIKNFIRSIFPKSKEAQVERTIEKVRTKVSQWVRGEAILMFSVGLLSFIGLHLLGIKFALTLAVIAGLLEIIPFLGPVASAVPAAFIGFTQSPVLGFLVIVLYIGIQQFENHILVPKVMEKTTGISPVVIVLSLLIGAKLMGLLGIFLAVPVAVILSVFVEDILKKNSEETVAS